MTHCLCLSISTQQIPSLECLKRNQNNKPKNKLKKIKLKSFQSRVAFPKRKDQLMPSQIAHLMHFLPCPTIHITVYLLCTGHPDRHKRPASEQNRQPPSSQWRMFSENNSNQRITQTCTTTNHGHCNGGKVSPHFVRGYFPYEPVGRQS